MFGDRLWIFSIFSVGFVGLIHCETNLKCNYYQYAESYACQIFAQKILNESETISYSGNHLRGKSDDSVTMLAFYQSTINYIPTNLFSKFHNLQKFDCQVCHPKKIEKNDFKNAGNLRILRLRTGYIQILQNDTFYYCHELELIVLESFEISEIELKAFGGLRHLKELYLQHNRIKTLTPGTFDDLVNLEILNLGDSRIEKLNKDLFKYNKNLKKIYVAYNRIAVLEPNLISHLDGLTYVDFRYNDCGDREDFYDTRPTQIQSTFDEYASQCTEENRLENKLVSKLNQILELKDTLAETKYNYNQCEIKVSQLSQEIDKFNKLDNV
jgi:Leucine-rich repeat (LRR) protein